MRYGWTKWLSRNYRTLVFMLKASGVDEGWIKLDTYMGGFQVFVWVCGWLVVNDLSEGENIIFD